MRSFTFASLLALSISVSALPSDTLDQRYSRMEVTNPVQASYSSKVLQVSDQSEALYKRHYYPEASRLIEVGYTCGATFYSNKHIEKTVKKACGKIDSKKLIKPKYPKIYAPKDPEAEFKSSKGNQYMYPILRKHTYSRWMKARKTRVVLNADCKLAGLVMQKKIRSWSTLGLGGKKQFTKCIKVYEKN